MIEKTELLKAIRDAFPAKRPEGMVLSDGQLGSEPGYVRDEFADKDDWTTVDDEWLDHRGYLYAFMTHEAVRFYIAALMTADVRSGLKWTNAACDSLVGWLNYPDRHKPVGG